MSVTSSSAFRRFRHEVHELRESPKQLLISSEVSSPAASPSNMLCEVRLCGSFESEASNLHAKSIALIYNKIQSYSQLGISNIKH